MPKVSVIVPVYNAGLYIERCSRSLFAQSLDDMEFIFVDDCSTDNGIEIVERVLDDFPSRKSQVRFLKNEHNLGQAGTRARGIKMATGDYVIHCDSDDWVEPNMYELLYAKAISDKSDIVVCDYIDEYTDSSCINRMNLLTNDPRAILQNSSSRPFYSSCCHLVNNDIIQKNAIYPIQGLNMWEDMYMGMLSYYYANRIEYVDKPLYHYNKCNENAITASPFSDKYLDQEKQCVENLVEFFKDKDIDFTKTELMLKKMIKDRYLLQTPPNYKKWKACYPEAADVKLSFDHKNWMYNLAYTMAKNGFLFPLKQYYRRVARCRRG